MKVASEKIIEMLKTSSVVFKFNNEDDYWYIRTVKGNEKTRSSFRIISNEGAVDVITVSEMRDIDYSTIREYCVDVDPDFEGFMG